jgi:hypothetical protein
LDIERLRIFADQGDEDAIEELNRLNKYLGENPYIEKYSGYFPDSEEKTIKNLVWHFLNKKEFLNNSVKRMIKEEIRLLDYNSRSLMHRNISLLEFGKYMGRCSWISDGKVIAMWCKNGIQLMTHRISDLHTMQYYEERFKYIPGYFESKMKAEKNKSIELNTIFVTIEEIINSPSEIQMSIDRP